MVQSDGKIVVAGQMAAHCADFGLVRFLADGSLDATFGSGGIVTTDFGTNSCDYAHGAALQPDGKILVAGHAPGTCTTATICAGTLPCRWHLDTAFGTGGKADHADRERQRPGLGQSVGGAKRRQDRGGRRASAAAILPWCAILPTGRSTAVSAAAAR